MTDLLEIEKSLAVLKRYSMGYEGPMETERMFDVLSQTIISMAESQKELIQNQKKMEEEIFLLNKQLQQVKEERGDITAPQKSVRQPLNLRRASAQIELQNNIGGGKEAKIRQEREADNRIPDMLIQ